MVLLQNATSMHIALELEKNPVKAVAMAFELVKMIPALVRYSEGLEKAVNSTVRHLDCKCEWCGDEFRVYNSELKRRKKAGRFCKITCLTASRNDGRRSD
jgi:hypothetical protein